jgi:hypothetical protein
VRSVDPNSIQGPSGFGPGGFVQPELFSYGIEFENKPDATAPAQTVVVTQQLDTNLDWSTFELGGIAFGNTVVSVPSGLTSYSTQVDLTATLGIDVDVSASFNPLTGLATWTFTSIDPATNDVPAEPLAGFLPPDTANGEGLGFVNYTIEPKAPVTGTTIHAQATVVFDLNAPLSTAPIVNTIDNTAPASSVHPLPAITTAPSFSVTWSGSDGKGAGIASYNIYVSDNGGSYTLWQPATTRTSAIYAGVDGHAYSFYSVATDNVGDIQPTPTAAQATTQVHAAPQPAALRFDVAEVAANVTTGSAIVQIDRAGNLGATVTVNISSSGGPEVAPISETVSFGPNVTSQVVTIPIVNDGRVGESDVVIPLALSSPSAGATLGSSSSASLVIHDNNPGAVGVLSLLPKTIKVGKGRKAKKKEVLVLQFSGALNPGAAENRNAYQIAPITKTKGKKPGTKFGNSVSPASAAYNPINDTVTLTPARKLNLAKPEQLRIIAARVTDAVGRPIDGNDDGQPGGDYVATFTKRGGSVAAAALARSRTNAPLAPAIDTLVARDELAGLTHLVRAKRDGRIGRFWLDPESVSLEISASARIL